MFRYPKDDQRTNKSYYEHGYRHRATDLPGDDELDELLSSAFRGTPRDLSGQITILKKHRGSGRVLDFGCSWGYGTWQLSRSGFDVVGYDVSSPHVMFAREHLGLEATDSWDEILSNSRGTFDIVFTNHTLEHLPSLRSIFDEFWELQARTGLIAIFVPDCTGCRDAATFASTGMTHFAFGRAHTAAFDEDFFLRNLPQHGFRVRACMPCEPKREKRVSVSHSVPQLAILGERVESKMRRNGYHSL
jgi:predicted TPR repeat methyltransferase